MKLPPRQKAGLERMVRTLSDALGENLHSCVLYGSAVRGDFRPNASDLNVLLVLNESTPDAHQIISDAVRGRVLIDPFVLTNRGVDRSFEAFALKFRSIRRDYIVLAGVDPFENFDVDVPGPNILHKKPRPWADMYAFRQVAAEEDL